MEGDILLVVRHADAGDKRDWDGPDLLRPLSPVGGRQAAGLVDRLQDYPVEQILSSPAVRCLQTVQPLARDRYLRIESAPTLGVDLDPKLVLASFWDPGLRDTVLCSHGELITWLLAHLAANGLVTDAPWRQPRARPGCYTVPTGGSTPAICPRWHSTPSPPPGSE